MGELKCLKAIFFIFFIFGIFFKAGELIKWLFKNLKSLFGTKPKKTEVITEETEVKPNNNEALLMSISEEKNKDKKKLKLPTSFKTLKGINSITPSASEVN